MDAYEYQADLYCEKCALALPDQHVYLGVAEWCEDSICCPQGPFPDAGSKSDPPHHCGTCRVILDPITSSLYASAAYRRG